MYLIVASVTVLLITLLDDNEAKPPIIVAYLRKPHICNNTITTDIKGSVCILKSFHFATLRWSYLILFLQPELNAKIEKLGVCFLVCLLQYNNFNVQVIKS
jgi:hypothetical protein